MARSGINSYRIGTDVVKNVYALSKVGTASVLEKTSLLYSSGAQRVKSLWFEKPIVHLHDAHVLDYANTYVNHNRVRLSIDCKLTKQKIIEYLHNIENISREQMVLDARAFGLDLNNKHFNSPCIEFSDKREIIRFKMHEPDRWTSYNHIHIYDNNGRPLNIKLEIVSRVSKEAHIETADFASHKDLPIYIKDFFNNNGNKPS